MSGALLGLLTAIVGVDVGWEPSSDGQLEYIIQIEPHQLGTLKEGEVIAVGVRPELRNVSSYRIVVGDEQLPRTSIPPTLAAEKPSLTAMSLNYTEEVPLAPCVNSNAPIGRANRASAETKPPTLVAKPPVGSQLQIAENSEIPMLTAPKRAGANASWSGGDWPTPANRARRTIEQPLVEVPNPNAARAGGFATRPIEGNSLDGRNEPSPQPAAVAAPRDRVFSGQPIRTSEPSLRERYAAPTPNDMPQASSFERSALEIPKAEPMTNARDGYGNVIGGASPSRTKSSVAVRKPRYAWPTDTKDPAPRMPVDVQEVQLKTTQPPPGGQTARVAASRYPYPANGAAQPTDRYPTFNQPAGAAPNTVASTTNGQMPVPSGRVAPPLNQPQPQPNLATRTQPQPNQRYGVVPTTKPDPAFDVSHVAKAEPPTTQQAQQPVEVKESAPVVKETSAESRPWMLMTVTLFALFASLGANLYLGWMTWDIRTRFREMVYRMRYDDSRSAVPDSGVDLEKRYHPA